MIYRLLVKNSAIFEDIDLELSRGLLVFSGASGSGKSVLMNSLLAVFGLRESNAEIIEANLDISNLNLEIEEFGLDNNEDILSLTINKKDKTRYFLNRYSSSKKRLSELVSRFGKHISSKGSEELKTHNILRVFDSFIIQKIKTHKEILDEFGIKFEAFLRKKNELIALEEEERNIQTLKEFTRFEVDKISLINPKEGEYERLLELKKFLSKKEKIQEGVSQALEVLENVSKVSQALSLVGRENIGFEDAVFEVRTILEEEVSKLSELEGLDSEEMLNRIATLSDLNRRYGSISNTLQFLEEQKQKLQHYEDFNFNKEKLQKEAKILQEACQKISKQISANRQTFRLDFEEEISKLCTQVLLKNPKVELEPCEMKHSGNEEITLKLLGSSVETLSAGEYNRLRLVMMWLDAFINASRGVLILDEIDANLSGEESEGVAKVLKNLSKTYQIFAISHQPHMPALADYHYLVEKNNNKSNVRLLDEEGRVIEMARMISGSNITQEALDFAKKRLQEHLQERINHNESSYQGTP